MRNNTNLFEENNVTILTTTVVIWHEKLESHYNR